MAAPPSPTAVLLHGVPTGPSLWDGVCAALDELVPSGVGLRVLRPCLPGYVGTLGTPRLADCGIEAHLDWLDGVLAAAGCRGGLHLVGMDYGGLLAAAWAARYGARSLTLTSTAVGLAWLPARVTAWPVLRGFFYRRYEGRLWLSQGVAPERREAFLAAFAPAAAATTDLSGLMEATARGLSLPFLLGLPAALQAARVPTLCLWGSEDRFLPPAQARRLAGALPGSRLQLLEGGRHFLPWELPGPYAAALRDHWGRTDPRLRDT